MYYLFFLVMLFSCSAVCEDCVTFNFENGHEDFYNEVDACDELDMWSFRKYSELMMDGFHPQSSVFATPLTSLSCMSSPIFQMRAGGTLEINLYLESNVQMYQIVVFVLQYIEDGMDANVLTQNVILTEGWQSVNITVAGFDSYLGYVALLAIADPQQSLLLDSLRYFAPSFEEQCLIYQENEGTTTATATPTPTATETETPTSMPTETTTSFEIPTSTATQTDTLTYNYSDIPTYTETPTETSTSTPTEITTPTTITTETSTSAPTEITTLTTITTETSTSTPTEIPTPTTITTDTSTSTPTEITTPTAITTKTQDPSDTQDTTFHETTTESFKTTTETTTTGNPTQEDKTPFSFWNAYTIAMVTILSVILVFVIAFISYRIGKRRTGSDISHVILSDSDDLPPPLTVPRVTGVYSNPSRSKTLSV